MIIKRLQLPWVHSINCDGIVSRYPEEIVKSMNHQVHRQLYAQEIRFIPKGKVRLVLSSHDDFPEAKCEVFYGDYGPAHEIRISKSTAIEIEPCPYLGSSVYSDIQQKSLYPINMVRIIVFVKSLSIDEVEGEFELVDEGLLPEKKMLVYGTSISQGTSSHHGAITYPSLLARKMRMDMDNYSLAGCCLLERNVVDFLCQLKKDYTLIIFEPSTNLYAQGYSVEQFVERCNYAIDSFRKAYPMAKIVCVDLFESLFDYGLTSKFHPFASTEEYRKALRDLVDSYRDERLIFVESKKLLSTNNLTIDLMHPSTIGYEEIANNLYEILKEIV